MKGITVQHISKRFGNYTAVEDVSFKVEEGRLAALLGPSGSGKSTILRIIAGLEQPDSGQIYLTGRDMTGHKTQHRNIGFVFQHYALFKHMTVQKNIAFGLEIRNRLPRTEIKEKVAELIDLVKLRGFEDRYPSQLSGGQRQRVALARALAPEPEVLLLDEPFGALDAKVRKNLAHWIRSLHERIAVTSIFVTHDQNEAMEIADQLILVNRGKIEQIGTAPEIYETPATKFAASFVGNVNVVEARVMDGYLYLDGTGGSFQLSSLNGLSDPLPDGGDVVLLIRPEDVAISRDTSEENAVSGLIQRIHYRGNLYEVHLMTGVCTVKSTVDKNQFLQNRWQEGETVTLRFKQVKAFETAGGFEQIQAMLRQYGYIE